MHLSVVSSSTEAWKALPFRGGGDMPKEEEEARTDKRRHGQDAISSSGSRGERWFLRAGFRREKGRRRRPPQTNRKNKAVCLPCRSKFLWFHVCVAARIFLVMPNVVLDRSVSSTGWCNFYGTLVCPPVSKSRTMLPSLMTGFQAGNDVCNACTTVCW
jgi:hypothetical protein